MIDHVEMGKPNDDQKEDAIEFLVKALKNLKISEEDEGAKVSEEN